MIVLSFQTNDEALVAFTDLIVHGFTIEKHSEQAVLFPVKCNNTPAGFVDYTYIGIYDDGAVGIYDHGCDESRRSLVDVNDVNYDEVIGQIVNKKFN